MNADEVVGKILPKQRYEMYGMCAGDPYYSYKDAQEMLRKAILSGVLVPNNLGVVSGGRSPACKAGVEADSRGGSIPSAPNSNPKPLEEKDLCQSCARHYTTCPIEPLRPVTECIEYRVKKNSFGELESKPKRPVSVAKLKQIINTCVAEAVHQSWSDDALVTAIAEDLFAEINEGDA